MPDKENVKSDDLNKTEQPKATEAPKVGKPDEQQLKAVSAVGYLGILFLLPYIMFPKDKFAVFHANQGLMLLITAVAINVIGGAIPLLGWFLILPIGYILILVLLIMGIVNATGGKMKRLPIIGGIDILKVQE